MTMDDEDHVLAAEYVLGSLDAAERQEAERRIATVPEFAALVRDWEQRLGPLQGRIRPVEPPPGLFKRIEDRLAATAQSSPPARNLATTDARRQLRQWRTFGTAMAALAAGLAAFMVTSLWQPDILPESLRPKPRVVMVTNTIIRTAEAPSRFVAIMQKDAGSPGFILTVDLEKRTLTARRVAAEDLTNKSYELWLVSKDFPAPRSLGLIGAQDFTTSSALANYPPSTISDATFAVSLEPQGGSPTGTATGPVLWTGKLVETVPPGQTP
jgi:anti-sigma-K factor RskA